MTAIGGCVGPALEPAKTSTTQIIAALADFGPDDSQLESLDVACFGRALYRTVPEDDFDKQPLIGRGGRLLFVADARVDNRHELAASLGHERAWAERRSDADLLLAAWERWGLGAFDRVFGDIAMATWDRDRRRLSLVRSANSSKPLFWFAGNAFAAFASMPQGLHELDAVTKRPDLEEFAATAAWAPYRTERSIFAGIRRVPQGHAVHWTAEGATTTRIWDLDSISFGSLRTRDYGGALRAELERAVRPRLRRRSGPVASHLSSGRDSSAVMSTAALLTRDSGQVLALTGAPSAAFSGEVPADRLADESEIAGLSASMHPNVRHLVCRSERGDLAGLIEQHNRTHFGPILNPRSIPWWTSVHEVAAREGAQVVLGGSTGNLSISAGGLRSLGDLLARCGVGPWHRTAMGRGGLSAARWRSVINFTFGAKAPAPFYSAARRLAGRESNQIAVIPWLQQDARKLAEELLHDHVGDPRPPQSDYAIRRDRLLQRDLGDKQTLALWGVDLRDPTADRRLVEFCLSLPPDQLVSAISDRPAFDAAFGHGLPPQVLSPSRRGYQNADWLQHFTRETVGTLFAQYRKSHAVQGLFDFAYIDDALADWPRPDLVTALSLASFVSHHFPD